MRKKVKYFNNLYKEMLQNTPQTTTVKIPSNYGEGTISQTTTKHGIGMTSMKTVVKKYGGNLEWSTGENKFNLKIKLLNKPI